MSDHILRRSLDAHRYELFEAMNMYNLYFLFVEFDANKKRSHDFMGNMEKLATSALSNE